MLARFARQTDIDAAMWAFAVNVCFAVFPFVAMQQKPLLYALEKSEIFLIFCRSLGDVSGKHTVKHENGNCQGSNVQNGADDAVTQKNREDGEDKISNEHTV